MGAAINVATATTAAATHLDQEADIAVAPKHNHSDSSSLLILKSVCFLMDEMHVYVSGWMVSGLPHAKWRATKQQLR